MIRRCSKVFLDYLKLIITAIYLSSSHHRLLNHPDTRRTMQRWRSVGPALMGPEGERAPYIYNYTTKRNKNLRVCLVT